MKEYLKEQISLGETGKVVDCLKKIRPKLDDGKQRRILMVSGNYERFLNAKIGGLLNAKEVKDQLKEIEDSLLDIISQLPDHLNKRDCEERRRSYGWLVFIVLILGSSFGAIWYFRNDLLAQAQLEEIGPRQDSSVHLPDKGRKNKNAGVQKAPGQGEKIKTSTDCLLQKPKTSELNNFTARLVCIRKEDDHLIFTIQISNDNDAHFEVCANQPPWVCEMIDNKNKRYVASVITSGDQSKRQCIAVDYVKELPFVEINVRFDQMEQKPERIARLIVPATFGNFLFTDIPVK